ncbi:hypothetical protein HQ585_20655 [candidate division KSB1 bacterium]|nr:hypothetical protein [candidate division KSB1 bacterium]
MRRSLLLVLLMNLSWLSLSCNLDGYNDLGELVNRFTQLGSNASTYMRTFVMESGPMVELMTFSDLREPYGSCVSMQVTDEGNKIEVVLKLGTFQISDGQIELEYSLRYLNTYVFTSSPSSISGATQDELSPEKHEEALWNHNRAAGIIRMDGKLYKKVDRIFENILSQESSDWPDQFMKIFLLCTMAAHTRIEGFGGIGMLQYINKTTIFNGLLFGEMVFRVEGLTTLTTTFNYTNHSDIACVVLNGDIINKSDLSGTGEMDGGLAFTIDCGENIWEGNVDYSTIRISETLPNAGEYRLTFTGSDSTYTAPYDYGNPDHFDLTDVLDPNPNNW